MHRPPFQITLLYQYNSNMNYSDDPSPTTKAEQIWWQVTTASPGGVGWMLAIIDQHNRTPLALEVFEKAPDSETIWRLLAAMLRAAEERGQKPAQILFEPGWLAQDLSQRLEAAGVQPLGSASERSQMTDTPVAGADAGESPGAGTGQISPPAGEFPPPLIDGEITPRSGRAFFRSAGRYYEAAPWKDVDEDAPIAVWVDSLGKNGFVTLLGQTGLTTGLAIYTRWEDVFQGASADSPLEQPPQAGVLAVTFEAAAGLPAADRAAIRRHRWPVVGPRAYPLPLWITPGRVQRPDHDALLFLETVLNALPDFVQHEALAVLDGDEAETLAEYEVETSRGTMRVRLAYPAGPEDESEITGLPGGMLDENEKRALTLAHEAWQTTDAAQRVRLAQEALTLSSSAIEAYLTLAEEAEFPQEALDWLEKAVQAGERTGAAAPQPGEAGLWTRRSARPYLRALQAKAETLEQLGRGAAALQVYQDLLRLNPPDHSGARYPALALLLRLRRDAEAEALSERYAEDDSPDWAFSRVLIAFRSGANPERAHALLDQAARQYPGVAAFLTGTTALLADPDEASSQAEADAAAYALRAYPIWWSTPGAIDWLRSLK